MGGLVAMNGKAWYDVAFDAWYSELYAQRDETEAERVISWLEAELPALGLVGLRGSRWVDLACGAGRHLRALGRRGVVAVGIDRSQPLIKQAWAARRAEHLVRGDLRHLPFAERSFNGGLSMFTSLGYFERDDENRAVLAEAARVIQPGGCFVVDYLNAEATERNLIPVSTRYAAAYRIEEKRWIDSGHGRIEKEVTVYRQTSAEPVKHHVESVALWTRGDLEERLEAAGFRVRACAGDYEGRPYVASDSPRLVLVAERSR